MNVKEFCKNNDFVKMDTIIEIRNISEGLGHSIYNGEYKNLSSLAECLRVCKCYYLDNKFLFFVDNDEFIVDEEFDILIMNLIYKVSKNDLKRIENVFGGYNMLKKDGSKYFVSRDFIVNYFTCLVRDIEV